MSVTYTKANEVLDYEFGATSYTVDSTLYVCLSTTPIGNAGTGETEPSGGAYARVAITNNKTTFDTAASGVLSNLIAVEFPESTSSWGTISHVFISDAANAGNILYFEALDATRTVADSTTVLFAAGGIEIHMDNS